MANVDKRWWWLSVPVLAIFGLACCCGGGGLLYFMMPGGDKVVLKDTAPEGDVRLEVTEKKGEGWTYELNLLNASSGTALPGNIGRLKSESQLTGWSVTWMGGICIVTRKGPGAAMSMGTYGTGKQAWVTLSSKSEQGGE
jgi:hypothetical protein